LFCDDEGVHHQLTVGYAPEQNKMGVAGRKNLPFLARISKDPKDLSELLHV
jgi:hypothetical protein